MNNREFRYLLQTSGYLPRSLFPSIFSSLILPLLSKTNANMGIRVKSTTDETPRSIHDKQSILGRGQERVRDLTARF